VTERLRVSKTRQAGSTLPPRSPCSIAPWRLREPPPDVSWPRGSASLRRGLPPSRYDSMVPPTASFSAAYETIVLSSQL
jgi:hypothetical protein